MYISSDSSSCHRFTLPSCAKNNKIMNVRMASSRSIFFINVENSIIPAPFTLCERDVYSFSICSSISIRYRSNCGRISEGVGRTGSETVFSERTSFSPFKTSSKTSSKCLMVVEVNSCLRGRNRGGGRKSCGAFGGGGGSSSLSRSFDFIKYMRAEESRATPEALKSICPVFCISSRKDVSKYAMLIFHGVSFSSLRNSKRMFHGGRR